MKPLRTEAIDKYQIAASPIFKITLARFSAFLTRKYSASLASKTKKSVKSYIKKFLTINPHIGPPSERLIELGIKEYRQLTVDEHNIVFYRIDSVRKKVTLLAVMDGRQSIEKLLYEVNLLS
jgi:toxin ParE1/3/4